MCCIPTQLRVHSWLRWVLLRSIIKWAASRSWLTRAVHTLLLVVDSEPLLLTLSPCC